MRATRSRATKKADGAGAATGQLPGADRQGQDRHCRCRSTATTPTTRAPSTRRRRPDAPVNGLAEEPDRRHERQLPRRPLDRCRAISCAEYSAPRRTIAATWASAISICLSAPTTPTTAPTPSACATPTSSARRCSASSSFSFIDSTLSETLAVLDRADRARQRGVHRRRRRPDGRPSARELEIAQNFDFIDRPQALDARRGAARSRLVGQHAALERNGTYVVHQPRCLQRRAAGNL